MKKIISLILAAFMLVLCLAACAAPSDDDADVTTTDAGSEDDTAEVSTVPVTEKSADEDDIPETDLKGYEFRIIAYSNDFTHGNNIALTANADTLNDAQFEMTSKIMSRFNCELSEYQTQSSEVNNTSRVWIKNNDDYYDVLVILDRDGCTFAQEGLAVYYDELPYVNLDKAYWDHTINESTSIGGKYFLAAGAANITVYDYTHVLAFNKQMLTDYELENPYELVTSGKWTFDAFTKMMEKVTENGDDKWGPEDYYGFVTAGKQILPNIWVAAGLRTVEKNDEDIPYYNVPDSIAFETLYDKVMTVMRSDNNWYGGTYGGTWYIDNTLFQDKHALFAGHTFYTIGYMRQTDVNFGLLPYPKWTEKQADYCSRVEGGVRMMLVPTSASGHLEQTSIIMEAMMCEANKTVIPAYYDIVLKGKTAKDTESTEMLDIILKHRVYDLGDTYWYKAIRSNLFTELFNANSRAFSSTIDRTRATVEKTISDAVAAITGKEN